MPVVPIDDPDDPRIDVYRGLRDHRLRMLRERTDEAMAGLCIVEGDRLIRRARAAGMDLVSILRDPDRPEPIEAELPESTPVYTALPDVASRLAGMHIHRWAMACFRRPPERSLVQVVHSDARRILIADRVVNPTNLGAMVRTAAGLGLDGLVLDQQSCDPLYRRASRVAMGASFTFPWARVSDLAETIPRLAADGFTTVALELTPAAVDLRRLPTFEKAAIVLGNEGSGVSERLLAHVDMVASIPMHGGVDSLNVTGATAVACWELMRPR